LVAASNVADYLERVRSKATAPDNFVFTTAKGKRASLLYRSLIENLLAESGLRLSSSGSRRSDYCFRPTPRSGFPRGWTSISSPSSWALQ
jgi:integrase